jgi:hypothetical protein
MTDPTPTLLLTALSDLLAICRLDPGAALPDWAGGGRFVSITRTPAELSIVCAAHVVPAAIQAERDWRALQVAGPLDFTLTGILAALAQPLAEAGISIFALSTYDTDYLLVRAHALERAIAALTAAGHHVEQED